MKLSLTLTANAGVLLRFGENGPVYGIDALHNTKTPEFSCLSPEQTENVFSLLDKTPPCALLITHDHADHYSPELLEKAAERYKDCRIVKPWAEPGEKNKIYTINSQTVTAISLPHRFAPPIPESDNYGFVISADGKTVFLPGDAEPLSGEMQELVRSFHPDAAILPFLWVTLPRCRRILDALAPKAAAFVHLPFEAEDRYGYARATQKEAGRFFPAAAVLNKPIQTAFFEV